MKPTPQSPRIQYLREFPFEVGCVFLLIFAAFAEFSVTFWQTLVLGRSYEEQITTLKRKIADEEARS